MIGLESPSTSLNTFTSEATHFKQYWMNFQNLSLHIKMFTFNFTSMLLVVHSCETNIDRRALFCCATIHLQLLVDINLFLKNTFYTSLGLMFL